MKGIVLAGGSGSRLYPITQYTSKQLLPIYDKPMVYYPISVLMLAGIKDILLISSPSQIDNYKKLLSNGSNLGIKISYKVQKKPSGIAEAFIIGKEFIGEDDVCLILGDNIFYGNGFTNLLKKSINSVKKGFASIFGYYVSDPHRFGVVEFSKNKKVISIEEKPINPKSNYAVVGLYFYTNDVINIANRIKPSERGELEITSINSYYNNQNKLNVELLGRDFTWLDTGTHDSLLKASNFVKNIEKSKKLKIACLEEIAFNLGYINEKKIIKLSSSLNNDYGIYLKNLLKKN